MRQTKTILKWVLASAKILHRYLAVSAEVFCRHTFGVRYVNEFLISFAIFFLYASVAGHFNNGPTIFLNLYLGCYFALVCYHIVSMFRRQNLSVHSYSSGAPWSFWRHLPVKPILVDLILEPGCLLAIGILLLPRNKALSFWIQLSGLCLFIKRVASEWNRWHHLMDVLDTRVEGERLNETVRQRSAPRARTATATTPVSTGQSPEPPSSQNPHSLDQIFGHLDPSLRRILSSGGGNRPDASTQQTQTNPPPTEYSGPLAHLPRIKSPRQ